LYQVQATDDGRDFGSEFVEEFLAVTVLLVGYIHLTYLNFKGNFGSKTHTFSKFSAEILKLPILLTFIMQVTLWKRGGIDGRVSSRTGVSEWKSWSIVQANVAVAFAWRMMLFLVLLDLAIPIFPLSPVKYIETACRTGAQRVQSPRPTPDLSMRSHKYFILHIISD
jgi:hypothetical protein